MVFIIDLRAYSIHSRSHLKTFESKSLHLLATSAAGDVSFVVFNGFYTIWSKTSNWLTAANWRPQANNTSTAMSPTHLSLSITHTSYLSLSLFSPCVRFEFDVAAVGKQFFDWIICQVFFFFELELRLLLINVAIIAIANRKFA